MGGTIGPGLQDVTFTYPIGAASLTATLVKRCWLVVGWSADGSPARAKRFFRHGDGEVFLVHPGETGPVRIPLTAVTDRAAEEHFVRLEAGTGDHTLVVCANPGPPQPDAFDSLSVEFAVERLTELKGRLLDAVVGSSGPSFSYRREDVQGALANLANDVNWRDRRQAPRPTC